LQNELSELLRAFQSCYSNKNVVATGGGSASFHSLIVTEYIKSFTKDRQKNMDTFNGLVLLI